MGAGPRYRYAVIAEFCLFAEMGRALPSPRFYGCCIQQTTRLEGLTAKR